MVRKEISSSANASKTCHFQIGHQTAESHWKRLDRIVWFTTARRWALGPVAVRCVQPVARAGSIFRCVHLRVTRDIAQQQRQFLFVLLRPPVRTPESQKFLKLSSFDQFDDWIPA